MPRIVSVNVGKAVPTEHSTAGATAIDKRAVAGPVLVQAPGEAKGVSGLAGDEICDADHHGGTHKALYAYAIEALEHWSSELGRPLPPGAFGENLTVAGLDVDASLIGERWRVGSDLLLEVSSPRTPCRTFAGWLGEQGWVKRFNDACLPGAYLRVVEPGFVQAGDELVVEHRPDHDITVALLFRAKASERHLLPYVASAPACTESVRQAAERHVQRTGSKLVLRPFRNSDASTLTTVSKADAATAGLDTASTLTSLPDGADFRKMADVDRFVVASVADRPVGYASIRNWNENSGVALYLLDGRIAPDARRQGYGHILLEHCETVASRLARRSGGFERGVFGAGASSADDERNAFLAEHGYREVFSMVEMIHDQDVAPLDVPDGVDIVDARSDDMPALWQANEDEYNTRPFTAATNPGSMERFCSVDTTGWLVARSEGRLAGFVGTAMRSDHCEITELTVLPEFRRRGIGAALLNQAMQRAQSVTRLHTDGEGRFGALDLYLGAGFRIVERHVRYRKAMQKGAPLS